LLDNYKCPDDIRVSKVCGRNFTTVKTTRTNKKIKSRRTQQNSIEKSKTNFESPFSNNALTNIRLYRAAKRIKSLKSWCLHNRFDSINADQPGKEIIRKNCMLGFDPYATMDCFGNKVKKLMNTTLGGEKKKLNEENVSRTRNSTRKSTKSERSSSFIPINNNKLNLRQKADGLAIIPLTMKYKKSIIKNMIKDNKIPDAILAEENKKSKYNNLKSEEKLDLLAENILNEYDVILQDCRKINKTIENNKKEADLIDNVSILYFNNENKAETQKKISRNENEKNGTQIIMSKPGVRKRMFNAPIKSSNKRNSERSLSPPTKKLNEKQGEKNLTVSYEKFDNICNYTYETHPINTLIKQINTLLGLISKSKAAAYDIKAIQDICKKIKIPKIKITAELLKANSKEIINDIKEKALRLFYSQINKENRIRIDTNKNTLANSTNPIIKYFVGIGNNGALVKTIMKERWWWTQAENSSVPGLNILWTPWKKHSFVENLPKFEQINNPPENNNNFISFVPNTAQICNHLEGNCSLGNKKGLYLNLSKYYEKSGLDLNDIVPLTFHIKNAKDVENFKERFDINNSEIEIVQSRLSELEENYSNSDNEENISKSLSKPRKSILDACKEYKNYLKCNKNIWIVKPGENTNRGKGILVTKDFNEIKDFISNTTHTYIIQKYIERPLLIHQRKFDIRCFALITSVNSQIKAYFYNEGYLRTSSKKYSTENLARAVHLTNEAVQIKYEDFGKFEAGNKVFFHC